MEVFVTGGTGFVGSHVVERLIERGHKPICLVRDSSNTEHLERLGVEQHLGELTRTSSLADPVERADAVIHIAGLTKAPSAELLFRVNGEATGDLVSVAAEKFGSLNRFVYVSSMAAHGPSTDGQNSEPEPVSRYGKSKLMGEEYVLEWADMLPVTVFRPPVVYGPRDTDVLPFFQAAAKGIAPVYGDGNKRVSLIYVEDLADAVVESIETEHESGAIMPLHDGNCRTHRELLSDIADAVGKSPTEVSVPPLVFKGAAHISEWWGDLTGQNVMLTPDKLEEIRRCWVCRNHAADNHLGWSPNWDLSEGAARTAEWYRDQKML